MITHFLVAETDSDQEDDYTVGAMKIVGMIEDEGTEEVEIEEVASTIKKLLKALKQSKEVQTVEVVTEASSEDEIPIKFQYELPASDRARLNTRAQSCMSESSTDSASTHSGIMYLNAIVDLTKNPKDKLDQAYFLGLLYFNLHYQDPELKSVYLYMCIEKLLNFYNLAVQTKYMGKLGIVRISKALIRAGYAAHAVGETALSDKIFSIYHSKYAQYYRASNIEKNFLKRLNV